jgi:DNA-binding response OmpR family regulator
MRQLRGIALQRNVASGGRYEVPKPQVLIIDDDVDMLSELRCVIETAGYDAAAFADSAKALDAIRERPPDVILTDLKMPLMNGFQLAIELSKDPKTAAIPVIALTGCFTSEEHLEVMRICGISARIAKPVDPEEILSTIRLFLSPTAGRSGRTENLPA